MQFEWRLRKPAGLPGPRPVKLEVLAEGHSDAMANEVMRMQIGRRLLRAMRPGLAVLATLAAVGFAARAAPSFADPMDPSTATPGEMSRMPEYCPQTIGYYQGAEAERAMWYARIGPMMEHMHHYCWGVLKAIRAENPGLTPLIRRSLLDSAISENAYVLRHVKGTFVLLPEIFLRSGRYAAALGRWQEALEYLERSRAEKADYWPAYVEIANVNLAVGRRQHAIDVLEEGLRLMPGEPALRAALKRAEDARKAGPGKLMPPL